MRRTKPASAAKRPSSAAGPARETSTPESRHAGPVSCSDLFGPTSFLWCFFLHLIRNPFDRRLDYILDVCELGIGVVVKIHKTMLILLVRRQSLHGLPDLLQCGQPMVEFPCHVQRCLVQGCVQTPGLVFFHVAALTLPIPFGFVSEDVIGLPQDV